MDYFKKTVYYMEEPKVNCLQGYLIAREARKYQKVMLSGLGGDELLGGYDIYEIALYLDLLSRPIIKSVAPFSGTILRQLLQLFPSYSFDNIRRGADIIKRLPHPLDMYLLLRNSWDHDTRLRKIIYNHDLVGDRANPVRDCFLYSFPEGDSITESFMQFELANKMVDDFLSNEDKMSMAHGLEVRVPFLDKKVIEFVYALPLAYKIQFNKRKKILRKMLQGILPDKIIGKRKHGFTFNPVIQFQKDLGTYASQYLSRERVEESGIFNFTYIQKILNTKPKNSLRWHYFLLWKIVGYHIWEDVFVRRDGSFE
jgi:asparagine synthase (glutamine-hydrolysing)